MKTYYCQQNSEEWHKLRQQKLTASNAQAIGNNGKGLESYIYEVVAGKDNYTNEDLERGNELEDQAREEYELETLQIVQQVGFIEKDKYTGCSPDGLIGDKGGIEIKCPNNVNYLRLLDSEKIDTKYLWQIQMNLYITGREWFDFIAYNPNLKHQLFIKRVYSDQEMIEKLKVGLKAGKKKIKELNKFIN